MNCDHAQAIVSVRLDGEYLPAAQAEAAEAHALSCPGCTRFIEASRRARVAVRIRAAESIPDLVGQIMVSVSDEQRTKPPKIRRRRRGSARSGRSRALIAAAVSGAVVGSLLVGGPWRLAGGPRPMAMAAIVQGVHRAAPSLEDFSATYSIVERGLAPGVPLRTLTMEVAFLAPQRFRLEVHDHTRYPSAAWTPTDITYIEDMPSSYLSGPTGCPADLGSGVCPTTRTTVSRASAYSAAAPLPADLILPLSTLGSVRGVRVAGEEVLEGRTTVHVQMSFARAEPLFPFLRLGGTWRPFFAGDLVDLWLDTTTWTPVRFTVSPSGELERRSWELRFGRPPESPGASILDVRANVVELGPPSSSLFAIPGIATVPSLSLDAIAEHAGYRPVAPAALDGLTLSKIVLPPEGVAAPRSLLVYTAGLDYVRIGEDPAWAGQIPFGPIDVFAEQVEVPGVGVGFYEPAGEGLGRRLAFHTAGTDLFIESNLPRDRLMSLAASLPIRGLVMPRAWRVTTSGDVSIERVAIADGLALAQLSGLPGALPDDYVVASAQLELRDGELSAVTLQIRQPDVDAAGPPVVLHVVPGGAIPPTSSLHPVTVRFGDTEGRLTAGGSAFEWLRAGTYLSLGGTLELTTFAALATAIDGVYGA